LRRLLQVAACFVKFAGAMSGDAKMTQGVGQGQEIVDFGREGAGPLKCRNRDDIIVPHHLVKRADPELCLSFTPDVAEAHVQLACPLE